MKAPDRASDLFLDFLREQEVALATLSEQFPDEEIDIYQNDLKGLLENVKVMMYYRIGPDRLDSLLRFYKGNPSLRLLDEPGLTPDTYTKASKNLEILLFEYGQLNSMKEGRPVDSKGSPSPWITYPALEFLLQFDYSEASVFEFGGGNSTLFWARRAKEVFSVETDKSWFESIGVEKPDNTEIFYAEDASAFTHSILQLDIAFDVIVIDSAELRYQATISAVEKIAPGGMVVFDNSDWYPNCCRLLRDRGFTQIDFHGFGPVNGYTWTTSVFFEGRLKFVRLVDKLTPVGGIAIHLEDDRPQIRESEKN